MLAELILAAISLSAQPAESREWDEPSTPNLAVSAPITSSVTPLAVAADTSVIFDAHPVNAAYAAASTISVNRLVGGIISYVRWPQMRRANERRLCVVGTPHLAQSLQPHLPGGTVSVTYRTPSDILQGADCDALYLGQMPAADRQRLIGWVRDKSVLTITDTDPSCSYGAMFCLVQRRQSLSFSVNLDAIARGPLRVDPRVLRIGRDG